MSAGTLGHCFPDLDLPIVHWSREPGKGQEISLHGVSQFIFIFNVHIFQLNTMRLQSQEGLPKPQALGLQARLSDSTTLSLFKQKEFGWGHVGSLWELKGSMKNLEV